MRVVLDTTVLSNFAHVQESELLRGLFAGVALMPPGVQAELQVGETGGYIPRCDWDWLEVAILTRPENELAVANSRVLDMGEAECLALAAIRHAILASDDFAARRLAQQRGIPVSGTIGVLLRLVKEEQLAQAEADVLLSRMIAKGYRSPVSSLTDLHTT